MGDKAKKVVRWRGTFRECFCDHFHCQVEDFERLVFQKAVPWHASLIARWLFARDPQLFREDFEAIREIANVKSAGVFKTEINRFYGRNVRDKGWVRGTFGIRLSAKRLIGLKNRVVFRKPSRQTEIDDILKG